MAKSCLTLVHLTASRFFGGPERQMLGLAGRLRAPRRDHDVATKSPQTTGSHVAEDRGQAKAHDLVAKSGQHGDPVAPADRGQTIDPDAATRYKQTTHHAVVGEPGHTGRGGNSGRLETAFLSFAEEGLCRDFLECARREGFEARALKHDFPHLLAAACELRHVLQELGARVIFCHGYKANLVGLAAARRMGIPAVAVSRGWTAQTRRVRLYEILDRRVLRWMDHVVCVSEGQAEKVRRAGVRPERISVIYNAVEPERFAQPLSEYRQQLLSLFSKPPRLVVGAAGRLSPEKGFGVLVDAAAQVVRQQPGVGFVLFGDGALRGLLQRQIDARGLNGNFVLAGFRPDFDQYLPHLDLLALPSFTEGLPNVVLEAFAAGVPVVATAVGGTPEVVEHGQSGYLAPPGDPGAMARHIAELVCQPERARQMGRHGRQRVARDFTFDRQAEQYRELFRTMGLQ